MLTPDLSRNRVLENQFAEQMKQTWLMLFVGITIGFVGLHLLVTRAWKNEC